MKYIPNKIAILGLRYYEFRHVFKTYSKEISKILYLKLY